MGFSRTFSTLAAGLLAASVAAADPAVNVAPRATDSAAACASSYDAIIDSSSGVPTPTNAVMSSAASIVYGPQTTVPPSLQAPVCSFEASLSAWARSTGLPYLSSCSDWILTEGDSYIYTELLNSISGSLGTETWCSTATANAAGPRITGFRAPELMAAAGLIAAVL